MAKGERLVEGIPMLILSVGGIILMLFFATYSSQRHNLNSIKDKTVDPKRAEKIASIKELTKKGRELIKAHYNSDERVQTVSVRLLEQHADLCDLISEWMVEKALGHDEKSEEEFQRIRIEFGKREQAMEMYYDHWQFFGEYELVQLLKTPENKDVIIIEE